MAFLKIDPRPEAFTSWYQEVCVVAVICLAQLLNQAGTTQTLPMMNILGDDFSDVTTTDKAWFMAAFPLTSGAFILISGRCGDLYGLKRVLLCGIFFSFIWALIAGLTKYTNSVVFFCICRAFQGLSAAFILPNAFGIIGTLYPNGQRKSLVFAFAGSMAPVGATLGIVFGAITSFYGHWEWSFFSMAIAFAIHALLVITMVPLTPRYAASDEKFDWFGSSVGVAGLILANVATNQAPQVGWGSAYVIVLFVIGIILLVSFFFVENRVAFPLIPKGILNRNTVLLLVSIAFGWASFSVWLFYFWSFAFNVKGWNPLQGAATTGVLMVSGFLAAITVGLLIQKVRPSYLLFASSSAFMIGISMLSCTPPHQTFFNMLIAQMFIIPFGMDLSFPSALLILSDLLPMGSQGMSSSLVNTMVNYSMSVALGFSGTAEAKVLQHTGDLLKAYRAGMYVGIGFAGVGCLLTLTLHIMSYFNKPKNHEEMGPSSDKHDQESGSAA